MNRTPPAVVIQELRAEVGFGCPVRDCGNPYLEWHHFDPPWNIEQHHKPQGMIALCAEHHKKADNGAYTKQQLTELKENPHKSNLVAGRFDWRRNKLLAVVGGNFYYENPRILVVDGHDVVAVKRDEDGYLLLSVEMLSLSREERVILRDNCWENIGNPIDLVSPPNGRKLSITYENGDQLSVEFLEITEASAFEKKYNRAPYEVLEFPLTVVEINCRIGGTDLVLSPSATNIGGNVFKGCFFANNPAGLVINLGMKWRQNWALIPEPESRLSPCPCGSGDRYKHCHGSLV